MIILVLAILKMKLQWTIILENGFIVSLEIVSYREALITSLALIIWKPFTHTSWSSFHLPTFLCLDINDTFDIGLIIDPLYISDYDMSNKCDLESKVNTNKIYLPKDHCLKKYWNHCQKLAQVLCKLQLINRQILLALPSKYVLNLTISETSYSLVKPQSFLCLIVAVNC